MLTAQPLLIDQHGQTLGLKYALTASCPHESVLFGDIYQRDVAPVIAEQGFILFEGEGIPMLAEQLQSKTVFVNSLIKNLFWHIDRKQVIRVYYPHAHWRPGDFLLGKKSTVVKSLKFLLAEGLLENLSEDKKALDKICYIIAETNADDRLDVNYTIAELSGLNINSKYQDLIARLLDLQMAYFADQFCRLTITEANCQILFIADSVQSDFCHARLRNHLPVTGLETMSYMTLKNQHVLTYPG